MTIDGTIDIDDTHPLPLANRGIRYRYADLHDVIDTLNKDPLTRQAYIPIWFPEDGSAMPGRKGGICLVRAQGRQGAYGGWYWYSIGIGILARADSGGEAAVSQSNGYSLRLSRTLLCTCEIKLELISRVI